MIVILKYFVKLFLISFVLNWKTTSAVIYNLNETEYKKMPPIFRIDPYEECLKNPEGLYCETELVLVSDDKNDLMDVILEYSAHTSTHYNHSLLRYKICVTNTCKEYYDNTTTDLADSLEACLNKTFRDHYGLKTKVLDNVHCKNANEKTKIQVTDLVMFALLSGILMLNIVGSLYDFMCTSGRTGEGIRFLTYFAVRRNWRKLVAPALEGPESRLKRLKVLSGLKSASMMLVMGAHSIVSMTMHVDNTQYVEELYKNFGIQFLLNGSIVVQTFFLMSGFLLAYNLELMSERKNFSVNWMLLPKGIILRWIRLYIRKHSFVLLGLTFQSTLKKRLSPVYVIVLLFTMTCNKYLVSGPIWHYAVMAEVEDCRQYWWQHLLYINNYNDRSQCMLHTWYLAADTQLYCLGLIIYIACRTPVSRKVVLSILLVVSIAIPVGQTYWQDLDGAFAASPEDAGHFFLNNRTFNYLYKRGHTNIFSYLIGMVLGFLVYYGQKINYDVQKLRKYRVLYYAMVPLGMAMILSGSIFYRESPRPSMAVRILFAVYQKPLWCLLIGVGMLGVIFKYEDFLRGIGEWHGWTAVSRLSYCAYLLHITVIRLFSAALTQSLSHANALAGSERLVHSLVVSYLLAFPCWMLVEQPFGQLMKMLLPPPEKNETEAPNTAKKVMVDLTSDSEDKRNIKLEEQLTRF